MGAPQEEGWPLGLQPLNVRIVGLGRRDYIGSMSFNTSMLTGSPSSSTLSSSDLDTESTGSFFHDRSMTLGSLIGVSNILELSRRSLRTRRQRTTEPLKAKKPYKPWIFSLCSRDSIDVKCTTRNNTPSLGQFLAVERQTASNDHRRNQSPRTFVPDGFSLPDQTISYPNQLFVEGRIAPPRLTPWVNHEVGRLESANNGQSVPLLFSCVCGQDGH